MIISGFRNFEIDEAYNGKECIAKVLKKSNI